jgi:hypothetical protein
MRDSQIEKKPIGLREVQAMNSRWSGHVLYAFNFVQKPTVFYKQEFCQSANSIFKFKFQ